MKVKLLGRMWNLEFTFFKNWREQHGSCDAPTEKNKTIKVHSSLRNRDRLEAILHECRHACDWSRDEEFVHEEAEDMARLLWRLGYRMEGDDEVPTPYS
jgi:hypothetical protein